MFSKRISIRRSGRILARFEKLPRKRKFHRVVGVPPPPPPEGPEADDEEEEAKPELEQGQPEPE
jgi:hypothetical protein